MYSFITLWPGVFQAEKGVREACRMVGRVQPGHPASTRVPAQDSRPPTGSPTPRGQQESPTERGSNPPESQPQASQSKIPRLHADKNGG